MASAPPGADKRGWILSFASGLACIIGSSIICIDLITRYIPKLRSFKVRKSKTFLSASLSLSFGVMIFSALYSILPEASVYFTKGGKTPEVAKLLSIGWFMLGVVSLSLVSEILHRYLPSSIVHCEHSDGTQHEHGCDEDAQGEEESSDSESDHVDHNHAAHDNHAHTHTHINSAAVLNRPTGGLRSLTDTVPVTERSPLLPKSNSAGRPLLTGRLSSVKSLVTGKPPVCTADGKCYGFSQNRPCAGQCLPHIKAGRKSLYGVAAHQVAGMPPVLEADGVMGVDLERGREPLNEQQEPQSVRAKSTHSVQSHDHSGHHHVPKNEFLNIGVQTSLAIALHKVPEGFITFATNHANPNLGFAVFLALFIHNISEGFAMSLPLFMALKSRPKAIFFATLFGGLSQPLGALAAFLWFKAAGQAPSEVVYGALFAVTAGIMANVAVQLYGQAVAVYHNQKLPLIFAFLGMGILGVSFAMTSD